MPTGLHERGEEDPLTVGAVALHDPVGEPGGGHGAEEKELLVDDCRGDGLDIVAGREVRVPGRVDDLEGDPGARRRHGRRRPDLVGADGAPRPDEEEDPGVVLEGLDHGRNGPHGLDVGEGQQPLGVEWQVGHGWSPVTRSRAR